MKRKPILLSQCNSALVGFWGASDCEHEKAKNLSIKYTSCSDKNQLRHAHWYICLYKRRCSLGIRLYIDGYILIRSTDRYGALAPKRSRWKIAASHLARNSIPACVDMKIVCCVPACTAHISSNPTASSVSLHHRTHPLPWRLQSWWWCSLAAIEIIFGKVKIWLTQACPCIPFHKWTERDKNVWRIFILNISYAVLNKKMRRSMILNLNEQEVLLSHVIFFSL